MSVANAFLFGKQHVGGKLGLVDHPVVVLAGQPVLQQGIDPAARRSSSLGQSRRQNCPAHARWPSRHQPASTNALSCFSKAIPRCGSLRREPFVAVDIYLHREWKPGLKLHVHQAKFAVHASRSR